ncbi:MAG: hypothetical protein M1544_02300, partial [Candidatus Marsarchaeota archaeon]|nr:hypothetical protein [Candidatus Marsarchaeota archaeon]
MQIRVEVSENIIVYREGSSIKTMLRKTDSETSRMPIYGNFSIEKQVGVGFSDDKRMEGKVFNLDIIADKNIPLGPYLIKGVGLAEEIIRGRRLKESI